MKNNIIIIKVLCLFLVLNAVAAEKKIALNAALPAIDSQNIAPLNCFGKYPQLDEATVNLGLLITPIVNRKPAKYEWIYDSETSPLFQIASPKDSGRLILTVWNWFGVPVVSQSLKAGQIEDIRFDIKGAGTWMLTVDAYKDDTAASLKSRLTRSFSISSDCYNKRDAWLEQNQYYLGSCFFPHRYFVWKGWDYPDLTPSEAIEKMVSLSARAGFSVLRIDSFPNGTEAGNFAVDETVRILGKYQIIPNWKIALRSNLFIKDSLEFDSSVFNSFDRNMTLLLDRYYSKKEKLPVMIELGNEPAHREFWDGSVKQYIRLYRYLYDKIHAENPEIMIMHGGSCYPGADSWNLKEKDPEAFRRNAEIQEKFYDRLHSELSSTGSYWPYHFHGGLNDWNQINWIQDMRRRLDTEGVSVQLFQTEGGACAWRPDFESSTWIKVLQKLFYSWGNGDKGWIQYVLINQPVDVRTGGGNEGWALLHGGTFAPRFQYGAWAAVANWFAGCQLDQQVSPSSPNEPFSFVYVFTHPEGKIISFFSEEKNPATLSVQSNADEVFLIDPMGNATKLRGSNIEMKPKNYPQYILFKGADFINPRFL